MNIFKKAMYMYRCIFKVKMPYLTLDEKLNIFSKLLNDMSREWDLELCSNKGLEVEIAKLYLYEILKDRFPMQDNIIQDIISNLSECKRYVIFKEYSYDNVREYKMDNDSYELIYCNTPYITKSSIVVYRSSNKEDIRPLFSARKNSLEEYYETLYIYTPQFMDRIISMDDKVVYVNF